VGEESVVRQLLGTKDKVAETIDADYNFLLPHGLSSNSIRMDPKNFEVKRNIEEEHIADIRAFREREEELESEIELLRKLQNSRSGDNYVNVRYSPYEWMREVRTEYYFRYVNLQVVWCEVVCPSYSNCYIGIIDMKAVRWLHLASRQFITA
jgi:ribonuclease D